MKVIDIHHYAWHFFWPPNTICYHGPYHVISPYLLTSASTNVLLFIDKCLWLCVKCCASGYRFGLGFRNTWMDRANAMKWFVLRCLSGSSDVLNPAILNPLPSPLRSKKMLAMIRMFILRIKCYITSWKGSWLEQIFLVD